MKKILKVKRAVLLISIFPLLLSVIALPVSAADNWLDSPLKESGLAKDKNAIENTVSLESVDEKHVKEIMNGFSCTIFVHEGCAVDLDRRLALSKTTALASLGTLIGGMYTNPPASFTYYAYDVLQNIGFAPKVYGQGIGFSGLKPILPLWKAFRNIAYMLIVVVLIVIGFMIMFRMKINPQTVISIQNALPRIAVTLLLIAFSYAIAGFLIDLMYLAILLIIAVFGYSGLINISKISDLQEQYLVGGLPDLFGAVFFPGFNALSSWIKNFGLLGLVGGGIAKIVGVLPAMTVGAISSIVGTAVFGALSAGALIVLLLGLALLFMFLRIFMMLCSAYIQIIVSIIFGPLQIVMGAFPGAGGFRSWLLGLVSNIIIFPATAALLILAMILAATPEMGELWGPPMLFTGLPGVLRGLLALGMLSLIPSIVGSIKKGFAAAPMFPIGAASVAEPAMAPISSAVQLATTAKLLGVTDILNRGKQETAAVGQGMPSPVDQLAQELLKRMGGERKE